MSRGLRFALRRRGALAASALALSLLAYGCVNRDVIGVTVGTVTVSPAVLQGLVAGGTVQLQAVVTDVEGRNLRRARVMWTSETPAVVTVDSTGLVTTVGAGVGTIRADFQGVSDTATITVVAPEIAVEPDSAVLVGEVGAADPAPVALRVFDAGDGGNLTSLSIAVVYPTGETADWLTAELDSVGAPTDLVLSASTATLPVGLYEATVRITDDRAAPFDVPVRLSLTGFTVAETGTGSLLSEAGSTDSLTVVLDAAPDTAVVLAVVSSLPTEIAVSPDTVTFTPGNWDTPQVIVLTGVNDLVRDGDRSVDITVSVDDARSDDRFDPIVDRVISAINTDDDIGTFSLNTTGPVLQLSESGSIDDFTVALDAQPLDTVVFQLTVGDTTEVALSPAVLTFAPTDWDIPQTVTLQGVDDDLIDGAQSSVVYVAVDSTRSDLAFVALGRDSVSILTADDDAAGVSVSITAPPSALVDSTSVSEAATTDSIIVVLEAQPTTDVVFTVTPSDAGEVAISSPVLTFTETDWNTPQTITVTGVDDLAIDGDQVTLVTVAINAGASDDAFDAVAPVRVQVTTIDDDVGGLEILESDGTTMANEAGPPSDAFLVTLAAEPATDVTVDVVSSDLTEVTVSPARLTFTQSDWNVAQSVSVTGVDDLFDDGDLEIPVVLTVDPTVSDDDFDAATPDSVLVRNIDDDTAGLTIVQTESLSVVDESGLRDTMTVVLDARPIEPVIVTVLSSDTTEVSVSAALLNFTTDDWNVAQTVVIFGEDDTEADGNRPALIAVGVSEGLSDPTFATVSDRTILVTNLDDDEVSISVTPASGLQTSEAGASATFEVVLNAAPSADVTVPVVSDDPSEGEVDRASLTFTSTSWNTPQVVAVTGVADDIDDGPQPYSIQIGPVVSTDPGYGGLDPSDVSVVNLDDDRAGITVTPTTGLETTEAGATAQFTVVLDSEPIADVVIDVTSSDEAEGLVDRLSLTFTSANWDSPQVVTVSGVDDAVDEADRTAFSVLLSPAASADPGYDGLDPTDVSAVNFDDDGLGVLITPTSGLQTTESGGTAQFEVELGSQPTANVVVTLTSSDPSEGTVQPSVTFTSTNWDDPQIVTIAGQPDDFDDGDVDYLIQTAAVASADMNYDGLEVPDISVTNLDDDQADFTVGVVSGDVNEAGTVTATFTVELEAQPAPGTEVIILVEAEDGTELVAVPASLSFLPSNWTDIRTVTVTGLDDPLIDGDQSTDVVLTIDDPNSDPAFALLPIQSVAVTNLDDDEAGFTIVDGGAKVVDEAGTVTATFGLVLNAQPAGSVRLDITSDDGGEAITTRTAVTFQPGAWDVEQTVTIQGVDDAEADGPQDFNIVISVDQLASDGLFIAVPDQIVPVTNTDNDQAGVTVSPTSGLITTEAGGTAEISVVLNTAPSDDVTIAVSSSDVTEGDVTDPALGTLTFTAATWDSPQLVTITGLNDDIADGDQPYSIVTGDAVSSDPTYSGRVVDDVTVTNTDDDAVDITVSPTSGLETTEFGGTAQFTVVLQSEPTDDVVIDVTSSNELEGTVDEAELTFTSSNWFLAQPILVTGEDDAVLDGNVGYSIQLSPAISTDAGYSGFDPTDVGVVNLDDDAVSISVSPTSGLQTTEAGGTAEFEVVLGSQPSADVVIALTSSDPTEGAVSPPSLTFTSTDWATPKTVTITGQPDDFVDGDIDYVIQTASAASTDPNYDGLDVDDVSVTNADPDVADVITGPISNAVNEAGTTATFSVSLGAQPTPGTEVVILVSAEDGTELAASPSTFTFTPGDWTNVRTVTVTGLDDAVIDGDVTTNVVLSIDDPLSDPAFALVPNRSVAVTNDDDDEAGFTIVDGVDKVVDEAGTLTETFGLVLDAEPLSAVRLTITSDETEATTAPTAVIFQPGAWNVEQLITIEGVDDFEADDDQTFYLVVSVDSTNSDDAFDDLPDDSVQVTTTDDDAVGIDINEFGSVSVSEFRTTDAFEVVLTSRPASDVEVTSVSSNLDAVVVSSGDTLTFTPDNWDNPQSVEVTGVDDDVLGSRSTDVLVSVNDANSDNAFDGLSETVTVTTTDNDQAGVTIVTVGPVVLAENSSDAFAVRLDAQPASDVVLAVTSEDLGEATVSAGASPADSLTFTAANWADPQVVTLIGVTDGVVDGDQPVNITVAVDPTRSDGSYSGVTTPPVPATVQSIEAPDFLLTNTLNLTTGEDGTQATFFAELAFEPVGQVALDVTPDDPSEVTVVGALPLFDATNWFTPQEIVLEGVDDNIDDGDDLTFVTVSVGAGSDPLWAGVADADVAVTNTDDDDTGVVVTSGLTTTEAGPGTDQFNIRLTSEPTAAVTIPLTSTNTDEGTVQASVELNSVNWQTGVAVTVTGVNDDIDDGDQPYTIRTGDPSSTDLTYNVTVTPTSGLVTTEAGGTDQFTITLDSEPTADVTISLTSSDTGEGTVSPASAVLNSVNWQTGVAVTVTGVNDDIDDGDQPYTITTGAASSTDSNYSGLAVDDCYGDTDEWTGHDRGGWYRPVHDHARLRADRRRHDLADLVGHG